MFGAHSSDSLFNNRGQLEESLNNTTRLLETLDQANRLGEADEYNYLLTGMEGLIGQFSDNHYDLQHEIHEIMETSRMGMLTHEKLVEMVSAEQVRSHYLSNIVGSLRDQIENLFMTIMASADNDSADPEELLDKVSTNVNLMWKSVDTLSKVISSPTKRLDQTIRKIDSEVVVHLSKTLQQNDSRSKEMFSEKLDRRVQRAKQKESMRRARSSDVQDEIEESSPVPMIISKAPSAGSADDEPEQQHLVVDRPEPRRKRRNDNGDEESALRAAWAHGKKDALDDHDDGRPLPVSDSAHPSSLDRAAVDPLYQTSLAGSADGALGDEGSSLDGGASIESSIASADPHSQGVHHDEEVAGGHASHSHSKKHHHRSAGHSGHSSHKKSHHNRTQRRSQDSSHDGQDSPGGMQGSSNSAEPTSRSRRPTLTNAPGSGRRPSLTNDDNHGLNSGIPKLRVPSLGGKQSLKSDGVDSDSVELRALRRALEEERAKYRHDAEQWKQLREENQALRSRLLAPRESGTSWPSGAATTDASAMTIQPGLQVKDCQSVPIAMLPTVEPIGSDSRGQTASDQRSAPQVRSATPLVEVETVPRSLSQHEELKMAESSARQLSFRTPADNAFSPDGISSLVTSGTPLPVEVQGTADPGNLKIALPSWDSLTPEQQQLIVSLSSSLAQLGPSVNSHRQLFECIRPADSLGQVAEVVPVQDAAKDSLDRFEANAQLPRRLPSHQDVEIMRNMSVRGSPIRAPNESQQVRVAAVTKSQNMAVASRTSATKGPTTNDSLPLSEIARRSGREVEDSVNMHLRDQGVHDAKLHRIIGEFVRALMHAGGEGISVDDPKEKVQDKLRLIKLSIPSAAKNTSECGVNTEVAMLASGHPSAGATNSAGGNRVLESVRTQYEDAVQVGLEESRGFELPIYDTQENMLITRTYRPPRKKEEFLALLGRAEEPLQFLLFHFGPYLSKLDTARLEIACWKLTDRLDKQLLPNGQPAPKDETPGRWMKMKEMVERLSRNMSLLDEESTVLEVVVGDLEGMVQDAIHIVKSARVNGSIVFPFRQAASSPAVRSRTDSGGEEQVRGKAADKLSHLFTIQDPDIRLMESHIFDTQRILGEVEARILVANVQQLEFRAFFQALQSLGPVELASLVHEFSDVRQCMIASQAVQTRLYEIQQRLLLVQDRCQRHALFSFIPRVFSGTQQSGEYQSGSGRFQMSSFLNSESPRPTGEEQAQLVKLVEELEEELKAVVEEKEDLESELLESVNARDRTPDAILFFSLMHEPSFVPNLQQLCLQLKHVKGFIDYTVQMDFVMLRKRLQICLVLAPSVEKLLEKYGLMYKQWSHFRRKWFAERNLRGGSAESFTTCPLCYHSLGVDEESQKKPQRGKHPSRAQAAPILSNGPVGHAAAAVASTQDELRPRRVVSHSISLPALQKV